jgi:hypothetical protein
MDFEMSDASEETVLCHLPVYQPGAAVRYGNDDAIIDYVIVRKGDLMVRLRAHAHPVPADSIKVPLRPVVWHRRQSNNTM